MTRNIALAGLAALAALAAALLPSTVAANIRPRSELALVSAVGAPGKTVVLQVKLRDRPGTPLGLDRPFGERIQGLALRVRCIPEGAVQAVTVRRTGVTAPLSPMFEARPVSGRSAGLVVSFDEARQLVPTDPPTRGGWVKVARVEVKLAPGVAPGTVVEVRFDPQATALSNQAGTIAETPGNGWLAAHDGKITVGF